MEAEFPGQSPGQEVVKVVLVGDNGVGKTRLVCARAYLQSVPLAQLVKTHGEFYYKVKVFLHKPHSSQCQQSGPSTNTEYTKMFWTNPT